MFEAIKLLLMLANDCSRVVTLLLAKFGYGDITSATRQERKMMLAFQRVLLDAAHSDSMIEAEEDEEGGQ
ncbi:hypothetical protein Y032_0472g2069 [Ancylostoma ceylanicum]|uniref:Uncharacterized protein n=1 Tax=Ancylostoma ceylanicum TaxID=53326 RepID=A0A016WX04_9BILA|nr:hypothetical protein Y032_0472g2069 [Ancylostoma ceylanicum]